MPPPSTAIQSDGRDSPRRTNRERHCHGCHRRPPALPPPSTRNRKCEAVPAQISPGPGADVGESRRRCEAVPRRRCGPVPAQMRSSPGADVGESRRRREPAPAHASTLLPPHRPGPGERPRLPNGAGQCQLFADGPQAVDRRKGRREGSGDGPVPYPCGHRDAPVAHALGRVPLHHAARSWGGGPVGATGGWDSQVGERMDGSELRARGMWERKRGAC
jgi:hypothetical protein